MSKKRNGGGLPGFGTTKKPQTPKFRLTLAIRQLSKKFPQLAIDFVHSWNLVKFLLAVEVVVNLLVIKYVRYTEIDWSTYMSQVGQIFNTSNFNFNYTQIEGPTGSLVYPAGHVYIYSLFSLLTEGGTDILLAQHMYMLIYMGQLFLVYKIYSHKRVYRVPPYMFAIMCLTSYRVHSIYILRLFNDPIAVLFAYGSLYALLRKKYEISALLFSFGVSIKMNILLYAPAYALIFYEELGLLKSMKNAAIAIGTQLLLALPFLLKDPYAYYHRAFDFGRVFAHKWTVNWRFLEEETFTSPQFFKLLLAVHIFLLLIMFWSRWLNILFMNKFPFHIKKEDPILTLFIANFIGVVCSRSLHYQFYVWYYHSLPMLVWATRFSSVFKLLLLGCIEFSWNEYPSTTFSSLLLHASHLTILIGLFLRHFKTHSSAPSTNSKSAVKKKR